MSTVSVLGLGGMGAGIAANLADAGHLVTVWNRTTTAADVVAENNPGITVARTRRDAATASDVVISMVTDDQASRVLWLDPAEGALAAVPSDSVVVESSTVTPGWAIELSAAAASAGRRFVEAPIIGSRPQAAVRQLRYLTGGTDDDVAAVRSALEASAVRIDHLGPVGNAATVKLAVNGLLASQVAALAEIVGVLDRSPVDLHSTLALLAELPVVSPALQRVINLIEADTLDPNFTIDLVAKDLGYLVQTANDLDIPCPVANAARGAFSAAEHRGDRRADVAELARANLIG